MTGNFSRTAVESKQNRSCNHGIMVGCDVLVQRWTACWPITGTSGVSAARAVGPASSDEFDASSSQPSTAVDLVPATPSRRPSARAPAARSLELPTDLTNSGVRLSLSLSLSLYPLHVSSLTITAPNPLAGLTKPISVICTKCCRLLILFYLFNI